MLWVFCYFKHRGGEYNEKEIINDKYVGIWKDAAVACLKVVITLIWSD